MTRPQLADGKPESDYAEVGNSIKVRDYCWVNLMQMLALEEARQSPADLRLAAEDVNVTLASLQTNYRQEKTSAIFRLRFRASYCV